MWKTQTTIKTIPTPDEPSMPVMASQYFAISSAAWDNNVMVDMHLIKDRHATRKQRTKMLNAQISEGSTRKLTQFVIDL